MKLKNQFAVVFAMFCYEIQDITTLDFNRF